MSVARGLTQGDPTHVTTVLTLEISATRVAVGTVRPDGSVHDIRHVAIPQREVWDACRRLLLEVADGDEVASLGIGSTGPIDMATGITAPTAIPEWHSGFDLAEAVRQLFPAARVGLAYEGACLALAERNFGQANQVMDALMLAVSTEVTGGITVGGFTAVGHTGNAGNIGHMVVPGFDDSCACGGRGCLEAIASGPASVHWARTQGWTGTSPEELSESARNGEQIAISALYRAGTALGQAISSAAALLDVELVIVGGSFARSGGALWRPLAGAVATHARISYLSGLRVVASKLGDTATLSGAAVLALMAAPAPTEAPTEQAESGR